jgi:hypothetical protein
MRTASPKADPSWLTLKLKASLSRCPIKLCADNPLLKAKAASALFRVASMPAQALGERMFLHL